jgi:hypothetical protein
MAEEREQAGWRPLITKKPGKTVCCDELVSVGSPVEWHPAKGIRHLPGECGRGMQSLRLPRRRPIASNPSRQIATSCRQAKG